jgi:hypothetical protein
MFYLKTVKLKDVATADKAAIQPVKVHPYQLLVSEGFTV